MANLHNFEAIFFVFYAFCLSFEALCFQCPSDGESGVKLPDVTSILPTTQTGYEAWAEIVVDGQLTQRIYEEFHNDPAEGHVRSERMKNNFKAEYHYYYQTNECFLITTSSRCRSTNIDEQAKIEAVAEIYGNEDQYGIIDVFGKQIGPVGIITGLMNSDKGRFYPLSGKNVKKWIFCEKDKYYITIFFQTKSNYPAYIQVTHPKNDKIMTISFVSFIPKVTSQPVTSLPLGFGCTRTTDRKLPDFPQFAGYSPRFSEPDFQFYAELVSAYTARTDDDKKFAITEYARISFAENTIVLEKTGAGGENQKILSNLDTSVVYTINEDISECKMIKIQRDMPPIMRFGLFWPDNQPFSLLHAHLWGPNEFCKPTYFGQIISGSKKMDVYECIVDDFFNGRMREHMQAVVTYYFLAGDDINRSPSKVVIKGYQNTAYQNIRIDLNIIEYSEHPVDNIEPFDISPCFQDTNEYLWFQISFPDTLQRVLSFVGRTLQVEDSFREQLHSWLQIPRIRVPDIRISFLGPTMYISVKLLERLNYRLTQTMYPHTTVAEATKIYYLNSLQDCGQICDDSDDKCSFSYCNDMRCYIYESSQDYKIQLNSTIDDCQTYGYDPESSRALKYHLMPARKVVKHMDEHVKKLFVEVGKKRIFADEVYLISGPDDIGRSDDYDKLDIAGALENEYKLFQSNRKIFNIDARRPVGLSYVQCLQECENNEDCHSLSYCSGDNNHDNECLISQLYGSQLDDKETRVNEKCNVYTKNYLASYSKIPGKALVADAIEIKSEATPEECAKECTTREDIECLSFDLCTDVSRTWSGKVIHENTCFLHSYHIAKDSKHQIDTKVWDLSKSLCTHYSRQLSQQFEQYFLQKLDDEKLPIEFADKSMENCASLCLGQKCGSYEFCQDRNPNTQEYETTCRLSRVKAEEGVSMKRSVKDCSVYVIKDHVQQTETRINDNRSLAFGLSGFFFVAALISGAGSAYYIIWRRERND
ncbi:uncharacterized protein LOC141849831 [Brevipalpus obovatus]|uniref:uncharacterized protein LOC141849831 n=1 Tax=Brevipalpus obovatus TaxID=246614 RepID=UPI003D9DB7B6